MGGGRYGPLAAGGLVHDSALLIFFFLRKNMIAVSDQVRASSLEEDVEIASSDRSSSTQTTCSLTIVCRQSHSLRLFHHHHFPALQELFFSLSLSKSETSLPEGIYIQYSNSPHLSRWGWKSVSTATSIEEPATLLLPRSQV